jgi:anaphase-promoting complex subunit 4
VCSKQLSSANTDILQGQLLAIAWSDGNVRLVGAESSKTVHQIQTDTQEASGITCLGWVSNCTSKRPRAGSWKDTMKEKWDEYEQKTLLDLPRDLALIDIESSMPKLSVLSAGGIS